MGVATAGMHAAAAGQEGISFDFSGQVRERLESTVHPGFGLKQEGSDDYLLHRVLLAGEASGGDHFALIGEVVSGSVTDAAKSMSGSQNDPFDVLQFYADGKFAMAHGSLRLRAGRQTLALGAARLVSTRESTNVRRAFDGVRATWTGTHTRFDGFYLRPVLVRTGALDDKTDPGQSFWGLYLTHDDMQPAPTGIDLYYMGFRNEIASFAFETANELRHSVGVRAFGTSRERDWNLEAVWQGGRFGASRIKAWTLSSDIGYTVSTWALTPRFGLKADAISGDRNRHNSTLGTFNPLFPKLSYFSDANVATPANLLDVQASMSLKLNQQLQVSGSWNALWRYSREDAFYLPPLEPITTLSSSAGRYLGQQWSSTIEWKLRSRITLAAAFVAFRPGAAVRNAEGASGQFLYFSAQVDLG